MRTAVIAAALLLSAATASAQPAMTAPMAQPYYQSQPPPVPEAKNESTATMLAIGTTLAGFALTAAGAEHEEGGVVLGGMAMMLIGPSAGHFYAGENSHAVKMTLLRTGAALVLGIGLVQYTVVADCAVAVDQYGNGGSCGPSHDDRETGRKMAWVGGATLVAATLYDLWDAHNAAHRTNVREARRWTFGPSMMAGASGTNAPGLTLGGQF